MKAFDTDVLSEIMAGNPAYAERIAIVPVDQQAAPIVVVEEIVRGCLNVIRQAVAGQARVSLERAYSLLQETLADLRDLRALSFTQEAERLVKEWRQKRFKGSSHDSRIAATCVATSA